MADKPTDDDAKVMDVSKPGKGKIAINSRPLASPVVNETVPSGDVVDKADDSAADTEAPAPSVSKKVIQPLSGMEEASEAAEDTPAPESAESSEADDKPEAPRDSLPTPRADDDNPIAPAEPGVDSSDAAGVNELAKAAEAKRLESQKAKEEAEKQQRLDELVASKQYFVPIGSGSKKGGRRALAALVIIALLAAGAGGYFYWKGTETGDDKQQAATDNPPVDEEASSGEDGQAAADPSDASLSENELTPQEKAADATRKSELKALQQKVEAYFTANDTYPAALAELTLLEDELTDPTGVAYTYTSTGDSYVLSTRLADSQDTEAEDGLYTLTNTQTSQTQQ